MYGGNIELNYHYIVHSRWKKLTKHITNVGKYLNTHYHTRIFARLNHLNPHPINNYINIVRQYNYIKPEIGLCIYLESGECICILKTFWIKIIQRTWKKIFKQRKEIFQMRKTIFSLRHKETTGYYPDEYKNLPGLYKMLRLTR
jgi:hypothetical protein